MKKKYEFTDDYIDCFRYRLHRIRALKDFRNVKAGDFGGYILSEDNLSHNGTAWVFDNAKVIDSAKVQGDAAIFGNALIRDYAIIGGNAMVSQDAVVSGIALVLDDALVTDQAVVCNAAYVTNEAVVAKNALIKRSSDYSLVTGFGAIPHNITFFRTSDDGVGVDCALITGTLDEFRREARSEDNAEELLMLADLMELHFGMKR